MHEQHIIEEEGVLGWALDFHKRYHDANATEVLRSEMPIATNAPAATVAAQPRWSAPPIGHLKLNVDAGLVAGNHRVGCGAVVHDHLGNCLASSAVPVPVKPRSFS